MESLKDINRRLIDYFGTEIVTGLAIWRIVWSHDQIEKRLMNVSPNGVTLLEPQIFEIPKYRHYIHNKWILENLVLVPEFQQKELGTAVSYEPIFVFETNQGGFLPYKWEAAKFVIDTVNAAKGKQSMHAQYVDPDQSQPEEKREERISQLQEELFGNETNTTDALAHGQGVGYTGGKTSRLIH